MQPSRNGSSGKARTGRFPGGHSEQITVDGETEPVVGKLGVWVSNTKSRRDKLTQEQLDALRKLGMEREGPPPAVESAPEAQPTP